AGTLLRFPAIHRRYWESAGRLFSRSLWSRRRCTDDTNDDYFILNAAIYCSWHQYVFSALWQHFVSSRPPFSREYSLPVRTRSDTGSLYRRQARSQAEHKTRIRYCYFYFKDGFTPSRRIYDY